MEEPAERREDHQKWRENMEKQIEANTLITRNTQIKVDEVFDILVAARMAFKFFGWIGVAAKWVTIVAGCVTAVAGAVGIVYYMFTHGGNLPHK